jgi:hypothetical protein
MGDDVARATKGITYATVVPKAIVAIVVSKVVTAVWSMSLL